MTNKHISRAVAAFIIAGSAGLSLLPTPAYADQEQPIPTPSGPIKTPYVPARPGEAPDPVIFCEGGSLVLSNDYRTARCVRPKGAKPKAGGGVVSKVINEMTCKRRQFAAPARIDNGSWAHCKSGKATSAVKRWNADEASRLKVSKASRRPATALFRALFADKLTPHCRYEDGSELRRPGQVCKWDARTDGVNGYGQSYIVAVTPKGKLIYIYANGVVER